MTTSEFLAMLDTDIPNGPPVPTLDDYTAAFKALAQRESARIRDLAWREAGLAAMPRLGGAYPALGAQSQAEMNLRAMLGQDAANRGIGWGAGKLSDAMRNAMLNRLGRG